MADIDSLDIQISASVSKAEKSIDRLVTRLDSLTEKLIKVNGSGLNGLANGVQKLGNAMQVMNTIKTSDFTRLANNIQKLSNINVSALNSAASSMSHLTRAFNQLGTVSANAQAVGQMASNLSKLGNKGVQNAITNIPQLATAMRNLMDTLSKAPRVSQNLIDMTNALANLALQGNRVGTASNAITSGMNRSEKAIRRTAKSTKSLASIFGSFYANFFPIIRGVNKLFESIEKTSDYIEAFNYQNVALGKIASDWYSEYGYENADAYAESLNERLSEKLGSLSGLQVSIGADGKGILTESGMKNLGLNIQEVTQYASQLASVTNSVGQTGETSLAAASAFTKLGADISSLFNLDYSSVMGNLQSGLIGQSRALYKYGIDITNATLQTYAYELGLEKAVSEMTQAEKMQLRMIAILDQSKVSWGDLANTIESPSNMIRQFKNNLNETGIVLGQLFIPVLQKVMPVINGVTIAIKRLLSNIAGILGVEIDFDSFGEGYAELEDSLGDTADGFDDATKSAKKLNKQLAGFDELNVLSSGNSAGDLSGSVDGYIDLTEEILEATAEYETAWSKAHAQMTSKSEELAGKFGKTFEVIEKIVKKISEGDFKAAGEGIGNIVTSILTIDSTETIEKAGEAIGNFLTAIWNAVINVDYDEILTNLTTGLASFVTSILGTEKIDSNALSVITGAIEGLLLAFFVKEAIDVTINGIKNALDGLRNAIGLMKAHPYMTIAAGIAAVLGAVYKYTKNQNDILQMEKYGTTLEELGNKIESARETIAAGKENVENAGTGETTYLKELADQYFDLYEKENLTTEETKKLKTLYNQLSEKLPGFDAIMSDTTAKFSEQKKAVSELIAELEKEYKTKAAENFLVEAYEQQLQLQKDAEIAKQMVEDAKKAYSDAEKKIAPSYRGISNVLDISFGKKDTLGALKKDIEEAEGVYNNYLSEINNISEEIQWAYEQMGIGVEENEDKSTSSLSKIGDSVSGVVSKAKEAVNSVKNFGEKLVNGSIEGINEKQSDLSDGLKTVTENSLKSVPEDTDVTKASENIGKSAVQGVIDGANSKKSALSLAFSGLANIANTVLSSINAGKTPTGRIKINTPQYATGGFPEDGLFYANHNELVGKFSNGRTAVANNAQITDGIRQAAYEGMMQAIKDSGGISGNVNVSVEADTNRIFRVVQKKANEHFRTTGNPAFMF